MISRQDAWEDFTAKAVFRQTLGKSRVLVLELSERTFQAEGRPRPKIRRKSMPIVSLEGWTPDAYFINKDVYSKLL